MEAVKGIPRLKIDEGRVCGECQVGKKTRMSHPKTRHLTTSKVLELLHMDLMGPMQELCKRIQREKEGCIVRIRSDHGKEFENNKFDKFCASEGIRNEFSSPITHKKMVWLNERT